MADPNSTESPEARAARMNAPKTALAVALRLDLELTPKQLSQYVDHAVGKDLLREIASWRFNGRRSDAWVRDQLLRQFAAFLRAVRAWVGGRDRKAYYARRFDAAYVEYARDGYAVLVSKEARAATEVHDVDRLHRDCWLAIHKLAAIPGSWLKRLIPLNAYPNQSREAHGIPMSLGEWIDAGADPKKVMLDIVVPGDPPIALHVSGAGVVTAEARNTGIKQTEWLRSMPDVAPADGDNHYIYAWRRVQKHSKEKPGEALTFRARHAVAVTIERTHPGTLDFSIRAKISKLRVEDIYGDKLDGLYATQSKLAKRFQDRKKKD